MATVTPGRLLPPKVRALFGYVASSRAPSAVATVALQRSAQSEIDAAVASAFDGVEAALRCGLSDGELRYADGADRDGPTFAYDTRLLLPAMVAHARLLDLFDADPASRLVPGRTPDSAGLERAREATAAVVRALLDGDMRDAINDEEFEDFETNCRPKRRVAELARERLFEAVEAYFARPGTPDAVAEHYRHAVGVSEAHQDADEGFGELLDAYRSADGSEREAAAAAIRERYTHAAPRESPALFEAEVDLPYFATQYERVGILYEDMLRMYEAALDVSFGDDFVRAVVLMVIAAQIGLDDTDDYPEDREEQLTPVTAELALAEDGRAGVERVRAALERYLDRAERYSSDHLTGVAIEYVRQGSLDRLKRLEP